MIPRHPGNYLHVKALHNVMRQGGVVNTFLDLIRIARGIVVGS